MQTVHGKGNTGCEISNSISHSIIACFGLEISVYINCTLVAVFHCFIDRNR